MWRLFRLEVEKMDVPSEKINLSIKTENEGEKKDEK